MRCEAAHKSLRPLPFWPVSRRVDDAENGYALRTIRQDVDRVGNDLRPRGDGFLKGVRDATRTTGCRHPETIPRAAEVGDHPPGSGRIASRDIGNGGVEFA